ncbi:MAG TPA: hypothetical protein DEB40_07825 [Elusimicrobia bacterium]|nr:hypothetical protein [Elusimicrobiota bacterium]HBT61637.1 hypothetical protein [Elusimicrobiota bacterium]
MHHENRLAAVVPLIRIVKGLRVILDSDLARLYGVTTSRLNQQFRRNPRKFPPDFAFVLTPQQTRRMLSQNVTASRKRNIKKPPVACTEYGAVMAANVLSSERASQMSVAVVRAFIQMRKIAVSRDALAKKLAQLQRAVSTRLDRHDQEIETLFSALGAIIDPEPEPEQATKRIGFIPADEAASSR